MLHGLDIFKRFGSIGFSKQLKIEPNFGCQHTVSFAAAAAAAATTTTILLLLLLHTTVVHWRSEHSSCRQSVVTITDQSDKGY